MKARTSQPRRPRGEPHPSLQALLNTCTGAADAEEAVRIRARELVAQARSLGWTGPPFDPVLLAEMRGIKVRPSAHELRQDAFVRMDERGETEIVWNQDRPPTRTRFSIGHEITHTFFPDCFDTVRNRECTAGAEGAKDALERLCDVGAAELLMPQPEFGSDLAQVGVSLEAVEKLRERYQVSREAACIRAVQLADAVCAAVFLSYRNKPTEVRSLAQEAFNFLDRPGPKLRVDFMVASRAFGGSTLRKHKSIPDASRVQDLTASGQDIAATVVQSIENWPDVLSQPLAVEAVRIPGGQTNPIRTLVLLKPVV
jgi:Zn-dependent peptidase ImmA (M78 family)